MCFPSKRQRDNFTDEATKSPSKAQTGLESGEDSIKSGEALYSNPPQYYRPFHFYYRILRDNKHGSPRCYHCVFYVWPYRQECVSLEFLYYRRLTVLCVGRIVARSIQAGVKSAGGDAQIFRVPETLSDEVLRKMHAPAKPADISVFDRHNLVNYDAFLFGIPTRYGNMPAQWKTFWDATGSFWNQQALAGKYAGLFVSTASPGGGQEVTILNMMSTLAHHGIIYVPFGYKAAADDIQNLDEVHGGSPWGAGTFAGNDGSRVPTELESRMAEKQGKYFYEVISKVTF
ncbi:hypothetical protein NP233_g7642 [Leucocoprinus birnbaumii]|uniref:Flavodoxin-like domain-containing protein n=1 Tax=Leucocoprinus birnbaumii TaxID=56174 RepID=A0AAD5YUJ2_9AGAR|nr:hypothetical protein NP233_g7642 [Leucocoprinus birnbaumii]